MRADTAAAILLLGGRAQILEMKLTSSLFFSFLIFKMEMIIILSCRFVVKLKCLTYVKCLG